MEITLKQCIDFAKSQTLRVSGLKDWRLNKKGLKLKEVASKWVNENGGYKLASWNELKQEYGDLMDMKEPANSDTKFLWCLSSLLIWGDKSGRRHIGFTPVRMMGRKLEKYNISGHCDLIR